MMAECTGVDYYLSLPYTIEIIREDEETWFARVIELAGCMTEGDTAEEAATMILDAMAAWIEVALEDGKPIPEPRPLEGHSGKFVVRVPRSLHRDLVTEAEREGVSLNQYVNVALARAAGRFASSSLDAQDEPGWPGLKSAVRQALVTAGLTGQAGELDEKLFASHVDNLMSQIESAIEGSYYRDALWELEKIVDLLHPSLPRSPMLASLFRAVILLQRQVATIGELQKGVMADVMLRSRITQLVSGSGPAQRIAQELSVGYSRVSTESTRQERLPTDTESPERLFAREPIIAGW